jgi:hypothetical protein
MFDPAIKNMNLVAKPPALPATVHRDTVTLLERMAAQRRAISHLT